MPAAPRDPLPVIRRLLLAILIIGLVGTTADLILLEHYEDSSQLIPLFVIGLGVLAIAGHLVVGGPGSVLLLRTVMAFFLVAGAAGMALHYRGSLEFQREMDPTLSGLALVSKVMHAKAPPTLAPGVMAQLGLIGLVYTYRHPAARRRLSDPPQGA